MTQSLRNRLGFSAIGGCEAKAAIIVAILAAAGSALKPANQGPHSGCVSCERKAYLNNACIVLVTSVHESSSYVGLARLVLPTRPSGIEYHVFLPNQKQARQCCRITSNRYTSGRCVEPTASRKARWLMHSRKAASVWAVAPAHGHLVVFSYKALRSYLAMLGFRQIAGHGFELYPFPSFMQPALEKIDPYHWHRWSSPGASDLREPEALVSRPSTMRENPVN